MKERFEAMTGRLAEEPLPKCSVPDCALGVENDGPATVEDGQIIHIGLRVPVSDKCWYHANGKEPPSGAR